MIRITQVGPKAAHFLVNEEEVTLRIGDAFNKYGYTIEFDINGLTIQEHKRSGIINNGTVNAENFYQAESINNLEIR